MCPQNFHIWSEGVWFDFNVMDGLNERRAWEHAGCKISSLILLISLSRDGADCQTVSRVSPPPLTLRILWMGWIVARGVEVGGSSITDMSVEVRPGSLVRQKDFKDKYVEGQQLRVINTENNYYRQEAWLVIVEFYTFLPVLFALLIPSSQMSALVCHLCKCWTTALKCTVLLSRPTDKSISLISFILECSAVWHVY